MIVLGIDPGTAALGYGIVERRGGALRAVDHGVIATSADLPLGERLLAIHGALGVCADTSHSFRLRVRHRPLSGAISWAAVAPICCGTAI